MPAPNDFNANSAAGAETLQLDYTRHGLWHNTGWWNDANCIEALETVSAAGNGRAYLPVLATTFRLNCQSNFLNEYYDDEGWWALAWIHAYDLTGKPRYLQAAKYIFTDLTHGWTERCDGGLVWRKTKHAYKNAIPNELFLLTAIRLHQRTPGDHGEGSYLDWATREWEWFKNSGMINPQYLINDGLDRDCGNNGRTTWTYNQGVILGGLTDLYKCTGDTNYLNEATRIADAAIGVLVDDHGVLDEPCNNCGGGDLPQFKGIFIRYLAYLYDETCNPAYRDFLLTNARSVWANDRDTKNHLGLVWSGPFDLADDARQSSALVAISALAEPATKILPFARGAGSVTFDHDVGSAAGTLAWTCNASNAPVPGVMLSGACAGLSSGNHILHFRMLVDSINDSADDLVRLEIRAGTSGTVLSSRSIAWNLFTASNVPTDFLLPFGTATANLPLSFEVYWHHATNTPGFTLNDVTIDGAYNWVAANLAHEIGRLDGLNGWEADPIRDRSSGNLVKGPGTGELPAGDCHARFELKVDNFDRDQAKVATLSVVDAETGKIVASRGVTRDQFPDTLYHTFSLNFRAVAGEAYDFRTYWYFAPDAPRLTQRSVVVQASDR
ncbi:MAG: glycoside hydrolase family 76 protein [Verrucomicrobiota bacterium]